MVSSSFKTRLNVQILSHKVHQPLQWWCTLPLWEVNIGCVEAHWHVWAVTFTSAERVTRAPAARQLEISAGMQNLITTLIFTLSLSISPSRLLFLLSECLPLFDPFIFIFPQGGSTSPHLMESDNPLAPHTQIYFILIFFSFCIFSLYSSKIFFLLLLWEGTVSQAPLLYQFHQKANQQS